MGLSDVGKLLGEDTESLSTLYSFFPYKEALPSMLKTVLSYQESRLALGDSHELRDEFVNKMTNVLMYQTKPGLEFNDPNKRGIVMNRVSDLIGKVYSPLGAPKAPTGTTTKTVRERLLERGVLKPKATAESK